MAASMKKRRPGTGKIISNKQQTSRQDEKASGYPLAPWTPSAYTAFKAFMSARLCSAIWSNISDCDETFNYWEPMHYLMYGRGFQTWEYSPGYAIRSYAYLWLHALPLQLYNSLFQPTQILVFYFLRCILAFCCAACEVYFYRAVCRQFGANTGRITMAFLLLSTGMFISSSAFLPSTFTMYMTLTSMAAWFLGHHQVAIFATAVSCLIGWPFVGVIGIPIAIDIVFLKKKLFFFCKWSVISLVICLFVLVQVDSHYYGKLVIAPWNIVLYNVFSEHGPDIYGVEPWYFYHLNGLLNFNVAYPLAVVALPLTLLVKKFLRQPTRDIPLWLALLPMYIWALIMFTRPHKEERFLFPVYPLICLCAALTIDYTQKMYANLFMRHKSFHYTDHSNWMCLVVILLFFPLSISRNVALYKGYHAPLDVFVEMNRISADTSIHNLPADAHVNVCIGKEWYRFPSSYFLPNEKWHLQFIQSEFRGQLPKPYSPDANATRIIPQHMNDLNLEEPTRYINITKCHYLVDLDLPDESKLEPRYSHQTKEWKIIASVPFLHAARSHKVFRAFYVPFMSERHCTYANYNLLKTTRTKKSTRSL